MLTAKGQGFFLVPYFVPSWCRYFRPDMGQQCQLVPEPTWEWSLQGPSPCATCIDSSSHPPPTPSQPPAFLCTTLHAVYSTILPCTRAPEDPHAWKVTHYQWGVKNRVKGKIIQAKWWYVQSECPTQALSPGAQREVEQGPLPEPRTSNVISLALGKDSWKHPRAEKNMARPRRPIAHFVDGLRHPSPSSTSSAQPKFKHSHRTGLAPRRAQLFPDPRPPPAHPVSLSHDSLPLFPGSWQGS